MAWFFPDEATPQTNALRKRLDQGTAAVPSLWPLEVANVMLMSERRGRTSQADAAEFIDLLNDLPILIAAAPTDPEEIRQAGADLNEFMDNLKNRIESGERSLFP